MKHRAISVSAWAGVEQIPQASCLFILIMCQGNALSFHLIIFWSCSTIRDETQLFIFSVCCCCFDAFFYPVEIENVQCFGLSLFIISSFIIFHHIIFSGFPSAAAALGGHHISDRDGHRHACLTGHAPDHRSSCPPIVHRPSTPEVAAVHQHSGHRHSSKSAPAEQEPPPRLLRRKLQRRSAEASPGAAAADTSAAAGTGAAVGNRQPGSWASIPDQLRQREPGPGGCRRGVHRHPDQEHQEVCAVTAAAATAAPAETRQ